MDYSMRQNGRLKSSWICTALLCLSLILFAMPSFAVSVDKSVDNSVQAVDSHQANGAVHCASMAADPSQSMDCCRDGTMSDSDPCAEKCGCAHSVSAAPSLPVGPILLDPALTKAIAALGYASMVDQFSPTITHPPLI